MRLGRCHDPGNILSHRVPRGEGGGPRLADLPEEAAELPARAQRALHGSLVRVRNPCTRDSRTAALLGYKTANGSRRTLRKRRSPLYVPGALLRSVSSGVSPTRSSSLRSPTSLRCWCSSSRPWRHLNSTHGWRLSAQPSEATKLTVVHRICPGPVRRQFRWGPSNPRSASARADVVVLQETFPGSLLEVASPPSWPPGLLRGNGLEVARYQSGCRR